MSTKTTKSLNRSLHAANRPQILTHSWLTTFKEVTADPLGPIWLRPKDYAVWIHNDLRSGTAAYTAISRSG